MLNLTKNTLSVGYKQAHNESIHKHETYYYILYIIYISAEEDKLFQHQIQKENFHNGITISYHEIIITTINALLTPLDVTALNIT